MEGAAEGQGLGPQRALTLLPCAGPCTQHRLNQDLSRAGCRPPHQAAYPPRSKAGSVPFNPEHSFQREACPVLRAQTQGLLQRPGLRKAPEPPRLPAVCSLRGMSCTSRPQHSSVFLLGWPEAGGGAGERLMAQPRNPSLPSCSPSDQRAPPLPRTKAPVSAQLQGTQQPFLSCPAERLGCDPSLPSWKDTTHPLTAAWPLPSF